MHIQATQNLGLVHKDITLLSTDQPQQQAFRVQRSLDALRSKETFDNVILTDETYVEMGADGRLFFPGLTSISNARGQMFISPKYFQKLKS